MCKETRNVTQGQERNVSEIDQGIDPVIKLSDKILKSLLLYIKGAVENICKYMENLSRENYKKARNDHARNENYK